MLFLKKRWVEILIGILLLTLLLIESKSPGDFDIFLKASRDLLSGENIYHLKYHEFYHYYYDVFFALILSPFQFIPIFWANFIWLGINLFFSYRIWQITLFFLPIEVLRKRQKQVLTLIVFVFIFALWHKNMHLSQMTIFILYLCLEGVYQIENKRNLVGGLLIGLGISIKILPLILIPYLLYRGKFKATVYIILATIVILFFPAIIIGYDHHLILLQARWELINPLNKEHVLDVEERSFHSLTTLLSTLLVENATSKYALDLKRNISDVSLEKLELIINIVRMTLIAGTLFFIQSFPFRRAKNKLQIFYELSYIFLITPLLFPHQQQYAFFFIFPAISYLVFYILMHYNYKSGTGINKPQKIIFVGFILVIYFLLNSHFILGAYRNFYDHFKTLTYGVIILIPLLAISRPKNIDRRIQK